MKGGGGGGFKGGGGGFKGGGSSGGGFKGGGFTSGGGFKGSGFSGGMKSGGSSGPSRPSGGGPKPGGAPHHHHPAPIYRPRPRRSGGSFWTGLFLGSALSGRRNTTTYVNNNTGAPQNGQYDPNSPQGQQQPQMQPYLRCSYCEAEFTDTTLTKCPNCGAALDHRMRNAAGGEAPQQSGTYGGAYRSYESAEAEDARRRKKIGTVVLAIVIIAIIAVLAIVLISSINSNKPENPWDSGVKEFNKNQTVETEFMHFKVTSVTSSANPTGFVAQNGMIYYFVTVEINNDIYENALPIFDSDFTIMSEEKTFFAEWDVPSGQNYAHFLASDGYGYFEVPEGQRQTVTFVYLVPNTYIADEIAVVYCEFDVNGNQLGFYALFLGKI